MPQLKTHLDVYQLLPKTNCRQCGVATCLAFAVAVIQGQKNLGDCPYLEGSAQEAEVATQAPAGNDPDMERAIQAMRDQAAAMDLEDAAPRLGGSYRNGRLIIPIMGKDFAVDGQGVISSNCHVNRWLTGPLLDYVVNGQGVDPTGEWLPLRDLKGGDDWWRLFGQRCEKPLKKVVDGYTGLMEDMVDIFSGQPAPEMFDSDIAVVLRPFPKVPILLCYFKPEEGMGSDMHVFFDASVQHNLTIDSVYVLGVGLVTMFERIAQTHGQ